jgi:hypothetical protein
MKAVLFVGARYFWFQSEVPNHLDLSSVQKEWPQKDLAKDNRFRALKHISFFQATGTFKDRQILTQLWDLG